MKALRAALVTAVVVIAGCVLMMIAAARGQYTTGTMATVPLYGAGLAPAQDQPAEAAEPPWVRRLEQKLDRVLKLLEDIGDAGEQPPAVGRGRDDPPPEAELYFRQLSRAEESKVVRQVQQNKMPPPDSGERLTAAERRAILDGFSGRQADPDALASAGSHCVSCHQRSVSAKKGGGFTLFTEERR